MATGAEPSEIVVPLHETLDIVTQEATPERVVLVITVGSKVHQPMGLLHGGVSAVLAESAASMGSHLNVDSSAETAVGVDLNITHLTSVKSGIVRATAVPLRRGRRLHVWAIDIASEDGRLVAVARCTVAVRPLAD